MTTRKLLYLGGVLSPLVFSANVALGGALRPGYSHVAHTLSDLFTPGAPNKLLLVASGIGAGATLDGPWMGLGERLSSLVCFQWTVALALCLVRHRPDLDQALLPAT